MRRKEEGALTLRRGFQVMLWLSKFGEQVYVWSQTVWGWVARSGNFEHTIGTDERWFFEMTGVHDVEVLVDEWVLGCTRLCSECLGQASTTGDALEKVKITRDIDTGWSREGCRKRHRPRDRER